MICDWSHSEALVVGSSPRAASHIMFYAVTMLSKYKSHLPDDAGVFIYCGSWQTMRKEMFNSFLIIASV